MPVGPRKAEIRVVVVAAGRLRLDMDGLVASQQRISVDFRPGESERLGYNSDESLRFQGLWLSQQRVDSLERQTAFWFPPRPSSVLSIVYIPTCICMYAKKQNQRNINVQTVVINNAVYITLYIPYTTLKNHFKNI